MIPEPGTVVLRPPLLGGREHRAPLRTSGTSLRSQPFPPRARPLVPERGRRAARWKVCGNAHSSDDPQRMHSVHPLGGSSELRAEARPTRHSRCREGKASGNRLRRGEARCMLKGMLLDFCVSSLRRGSSLIALYVEYESQQSIPL